MAKRVLVLLPVTDKQKKDLMDLDPQGEFRFSSREEVSLEEVRWAQAIIGNPSSEAVKGSENLEFLQLSSAGCENYVKDGVLSERIILANATGTYGPSIGEYMVAVTLMHFRKLHFYRDQQKAHLWNNLGRSQSAESATILVVGAGDIGGNYARRMKALGSHTIGIRRTSGPNDKPDCFDELYSMEHLDAQIPRANVVALSLPNTPATTGIMDGRRLALMAPDSLLINVGRGSAVVTADLMAALKNGPMGGAALDVTDPEPLPPDHPLWDFENLTITPHNTGGSTAESKARLFDICAENFRRYLAGEPIQGVDRSTGYRASR